MFQETALSGQITFFQKLRSLDYILLFCLLILGLVSSLSMYSTEGGEVLYHTKSHVIRFIVFFSMMLIFSFVNLKLWHSIGYIFYFVVLCLLIWASLYGVKASGSQRWVQGPGNPAPPFTQMCIECSILIFRKSARVLSSGQLYVLVRENDLAMLDCKFDPPRKNVM